MTLMQHEVNTIIYLKGRDILWLYIALAYLKLWNLVRGYGTDHIPIVNIIIAIDYQPFKKFCTDNYTKHHAFNYKVRQTVQSTHSRESRDSVWTVAKLSNNWKHLIVSYKSLINHFCNKHIAHTIHQYMDKSASYTHIDTGLDDCYGLFTIYIY